MRWELRPKKRGEHRSAGREVCVVGFRDLRLGRQGDQGFNLYFCFRFRVQDFAV